MLRRFELRRPVSRRRRACMRCVRNGNASGTAGGRICRKGRIALTPPVKARNSAPPSAACAPATTAFTPPIPAVCVPFTPAFTPPIAPPPRVCDLVPPPPACPPATPAFTLPLAPIHRPCASLARAPFTPSFTPPRTSAAPTAPSATAPSGTPAPAPVPTPLPPWARGPRPVPLELQRLTPAPDRVGLSPVVRWPPRPPPRPRCRQPRAVVFTLAGSFTAPQPRALAFTLAGSFTAPQPRAVAFTLAGSFTAAVTKADPFTAPPAAWLTFTGGATAAIKWACPVPGRYPGGGHPARPPRPRLPQPARGCFSLCRGRQ
eukprot:scaffold4625_cov115-Isochrysis_galbana.AAC.2